MYLSAVCFVASIAVAFGKDLRIDLSELSEKAVGSPSEQSGLLLSKWTPDDGTNPEEIGEYEQGDILFTGVGENFLRNGLFAISSRWPGGIIPFVIDGDFGKFIYISFFSKIKSFFEGKVIGLDQIYDFYPQKNSQSSSFF